MKYPLTLFDESSDGALMYCIFDFKGVDPYILNNFLWISGSLGKCSKTQDTEDFLILVCDGGGAPPFSGDLFFVNFLASHFS